ncbi:PilZ domain-containing protein [Granulicella aggregans]|jgi:hypothetical protein|nr:PilZ domain-containing protein [Granulicella aggregans]
MLKMTETAERRHARVRYSSGTVMVRASKSSPFVEGSLVDISISGCSIKTVEPLSVSPEDVLELRIDLSTLVFRAIGFVRRASAGSLSLGIEFHRIAEQDKNDLATLIDYYAEA